MIKQKSKCPMMLMLHIVSAFLCTCVSSFSQIVDVKFSPDFVKNLPDDGNRTVIMTLYFDRKLPTPTNVSLYSMNEHIADVLNGVRSIDFEQAKEKKEQENGYVFDYKFDLVGKFLGKTAFRPSLKNAINGKEMPIAFLGGKTPELPVWVVRGKAAEILNIVFVATLAILIIIANFLMGSQIDLRIVLETIEKPIAPLIGFCSQFAIMPLIAFGIAEIILVKYEMHSFALGLFITGCCPGGGASNFWTILLDGNANLSITMTFFSTLAAFGMMPFWMWLLGGRFLTAASEDITEMSLSLRIPYVKMVTSLAMLVIPLTIGVLFRHKRSLKADKMNKALRPFILFTIAFILTFGTIVSRYMFYLMNWQTLVSGLLLPWCGFMFGCLTSIIAGQPPKNVTAIAIETGIQNTGIAIMLLKFSFHQPDADISSVVPVIVACFTPGPLLLTFCAHRLIACARKTKTSRHSMTQAYGESTKHDSTSTAGGGHHKLSDVLHALEPCSGGSVPANESSLDLIEEIEYAANGGIQLRQNGSV